MRKKSQKCSCSERDEAEVRSEAAGEEVQRNSHVRKWREMRAQEILIDYVEKDFTESHVRKERGEVFA